MKFQHCALFADYLNIHAFFYNLKHVDDYIM